MKTIKITLIISFILVSTLNVIAQDYSKQINAFKHSFAEENTEKLNPFLSSVLKFDPIPVANTTAIIANIVKQLPKLNSLIIVESDTRKAKVRYDFEALGVSESYIHFDNVGKITRIEFIENLIKQQMAQQQKMKESVQLPTLGELAKKHLPTEVEFPSLDGLIINGNLYEVGNDKPVILLCHQAGYNRIEYADIAPKLNELGYNCMAIDQRSGGEFAEKSNETFLRAKKDELATDYLDAQQDIEAAINYLSKKYNKKIIVWGSSYSSSLVLFESLQNENVKASISFSPGDYFGNKKQSLKVIFSELKKPFFITSSKQEATTLSALVDVNELKENQIQFVPQSNGFHGSKALWIGQKGAEEYWNAIMDFLTSIKNY